jgi:hypothetical protein
MARRKNAIKAIQMRISVTPQIFGLLTEIAKSGYAARSEPFVAEEMIRKGLDAGGLISDLLRDKLKKTGTK